MRIRYLAVAHEEILEAAAYYGAVSPGLGGTFRRAVRDAVRRIARQPLAWPQSGDNCRRCLLTRFPYMIIYAMDGDDLVVVAVGHQHREPDYWRNRIGGR